MNHKHLISCCAVLTTLITIPGTLAQSGAPLTPLESRIVTAATSATKSNGLSGQSSTAWIDSSGHSHAGYWWTDVTGADGTNIRTAVQTYYTWTINSSRSKTSKTTVESSMRAALAKSYYSSDTNLLIGQIESRINGFEAVGKVISYQTDDQLLALLAIQAQCFEFVNRIAALAGGTPRAYTYSAVVDWKHIRPGMAVYRTNSSHAAIIHAIQWDSRTGLPVSLTVFEANFGQGFSNPGGMVPWVRTTASNRVLDWQSKSPYYNLNNYKVVRFE